MVLKKYKVRNKFKEDIEPEEIFMDSKRLKEFIYEKGLDVLQNRTLHVIIVKDECIQKYIKRNPLSVRYVDIELCRNCGLCYRQFACPAINEKGDKAYINPNLCLGCGICEEHCPNNAIKRREPNVC